MPHLIGAASHGHNHAIPPIGFAIEKFVTSRTHKWNRNTKVTKSKTHKWNRFIPITGGPKTKTHKYNIRKKVLVTKTHRFNSGGKVKKTKKHLFSIKLKVIKTKTHKFSSKIKVTKSKTHKWTTVGRIIRTHIHKWNSGGRVFPRPAKTHKYNIKKKVTRTHTHKWNILTPIILSAELEYYKSTATNSLGGAINTGAIITNNVKHNLFDVITAAESTSGDTEYRCLYVRNISNRSVLINSKVWLNSNTPSTYSIVAIGLGTSAISGTEQTIGTEGTAPTSVTFSTAADSYANALTIGNLTAGQHKAVWIRRVINAASQAYDSDQFTIGFAGDTIASN